MATQSSWNQLFESTGNLSLGTRQAARRPGADPRFVTMLKQQAQVLNQYAQSIGAQSPEPFPQSYVDNAQQEVNDGLNVLAQNPIVDSDLAVQNAEAIQALSELMNQY